MYCEDIGVQYPINTVIYGLSGLIIPLVNTVLYLKECSFGADGWELAEVRWTYLKGWITSVKPKSPALGVSNTNFVSVATHKALFVIVWITKSWIGILAAAVRECLTYLLSSF